MTSRTVVEWGRLCVECRGVYDAAVTSSSGVLIDPRAAGVEDAVRVCGCAVVTLEARHRPRCGWFAGCTATADVIVDARAVGFVPACRRCVSRMRLEDAVRCSAAPVPSLDDAVRAYLIGGGRAHSLDVEAGPIVEHLLEGIDRRLEGWVLTGGIECGVDGCSTSMLDPSAAAWRLEYRPGLDAAPICSGCLEAASFDASSPCYWFTLEVEGVTS